MTHPSVKHITTGVLVAAICALFAIATLPAHAAGATYYVALSGNDTNSGTQAAPFKTIQHAASIAQADDSVVVRAGMYRETVTPAHAGAAGSPIIFEPFPGELVVISGADLITGWTLIGDNVYSASTAAGFNSTINQAEQVFVDRQMLNLAQFPNTTLDQSHRTMVKIASIIADDGKRATVGDPSLSQAAGYWNGATMPVVDADYYLFGTRAALGSAGEWFRDPASNTFDIWTPQSDNPSTHSIEVKKRDYAFDDVLRTYLPVTVGGSAGGC